MKAKFKCPHCRQSITVTAEIMGKRGKCPGCGEKIQVPTLEQFQAAVKKAAPTPPAPENDDPWKDLDSGAGNIFDDEFSNLESEAEAEVPAAPPQAEQAVSDGGGRSRPWHSKRKAIFGIALMVLALPTAIICWIVAAQMSASKSWPSVQGRIVSSHVERTQIATKVKYKAQVRYQFSVNGRPYMGSRIRYADTTGSSESAQQKIVDKYPSNAQVEVFYDPQDPDISVLEPGGAPFLMAIPPLALAGVGLVIFLQGRG